MGTSLVLKTAVAGFLGGCSVYAFNDFFGELTTLLILRDAAVKVAEQDVELVAQLGGPLRPAPWYNCSTGLARGGTLAKCTFALEGSTKATDISALAERTDGYGTTLLYNTLGPGDWQLLRVSAMVPAGGGRVKARHLLERRSSRQQKQAEHAASSGNACAGDVQQRTDQSQHS